MKSRLIIAILTGSMAATGAAHAGGYTRGIADTDLLYEDANFNMRVGVTAVIPNRGYATLTPPPALIGSLGPNPVASTDGDYSQPYQIPSAAVKFNLAEDLRCAGTYTQSFGADSEYGPQAILFGMAADGTGTIREGFTSDEFGLTCGYKFDLAKGRAWLIGGGFLQNFDYSQTVQFSSLLTNLLQLPAGSTGTLAFKDDYQPGYRVGIAYEIPEIALRAQLLYRSAVTHSPSGGSGDTFTVNSPNGFQLAQLPTAGQGTLPQSLELKVQSGISPGWLGFGSIRWTDWSVLDTLDYTILVAPPPLGGDKVLEYYYRDGWTVTGGVGHAFSDSVSGVLGLTWDRGVSTTEDALSDTYTLAAGVALKDKLGGEVRFGGAITYLTAASVAADPTPTTPGEGNSFGYSVDGDWAYALSAGYKISW